MYSPAPVEALVQQLKEQCNSKDEKWRLIVGVNENYTLSLHYFKQPHPKYLAQFVDNVALNGTDYKLRSIMHVTAFFGEPAVCSLFVDLGTTAKNCDKEGKHVLNYAAVGRVPAMNVKHLIDVLWKWDPEGCNTILMYKNKLNELLDDALHSENYAFYLEIMKKCNKTYTTRLGILTEPANIYEQSNANKYPYKKVPKSLATICFAVAKISALAYPNFRRKMKEFLPSDFIQTFVNSLPYDEFSSQLLDYFTGCPGVVVDAQKHYMAIYAREHKFREVSKERFYSYCRFSPVISVYDNLSKFQHPPKDKYDDPKIVKRIFENFRPYSGCPVVNFENFKRAFAKFTHNIFDGYDWSNTVVIGGTVLASLMPPLGNGALDPFQHSDIDVCFYSLNTEHFVEKMHSFIQFMKNKFKYVLALSTPECVTLCLHAPIRRIQIMKGLWDSIDKILMHVDIDCTGIGFNGTQVFATPRAVLSLNRCWSVVTGMHYAVRGVIAYEERLVKYAYRGFTIVDFEFPRGLNITNVLKPYLEKYNSNNHLHPYISQDVFGMLLLLLVENISPKYNYNIWKRDKFSADLPQVSKEWTPQKIRKIVEEDKVSYRAYGQRQVHYRTKYTPIPQNPETAKKWLLPNSDPEGTKFVKGYLYFKLLPN